MLQWYGGVALMEARRCTVLPSKVVGATIGGERCLEDLAGIFCYGTVIFIFVFAALVLWFC